MLGFWVLNSKGEPYPVDDPLLWGKWFKENFQKRVVQQESIWFGKLWVSTVFLGIDHSFGMGPPLIYETMIFGKRPMDEFQDRCSTRKQAKAMHMAAVVAARLMMLKALFSPPFKWAWFNKLVSDMVIWRTENLV